tara:strand:- start:733 stop:1689 length:957 start_codon:yes stop_codon:yes gene_type:complete
MIWNKLVDRCLLFTDAPGGLLKELLKEAEQELANKLELYETMFQLTVPSTDYGLGLTSHQSASSHEYHKLPHDYLRDVYVFHEGRKLRKISEEEIYRRSNGTTPSGTPTAYAITGDYIVFDTAPGEGEQFFIYYKARLTELHTEKVLYMYYYKAGGPHVWLDTTLGSALNNSKIRFEGQARTLSNGVTTNLRLPPGLPDIWVKNIPSDPSSVAASTSIPELLGTKYQINSTFDAENSLSSNTTDGNGGLCLISDYRSTAPLIPEQFHIDLCDYAIALANAKQAPDRYNAHMARWESNMQNLMNEAQDRDLVYSIKEEI